MLLGLFCLVNKAIKGKITKSQANIKQLRAHYCSTLCSDWIILPLTFPYTATARVLSQFSAFILTSLMQLQDIFVSQGSSYGSS